MVHSCSTPLITAERSDPTFREFTHGEDAAARDPSFAEQESSEPKQVDGSGSGPWPEQEFRDFLEAAPDAVVITDRNGQIIRFNAQAERVFGYLREELLGQKVEILMPLRFRERHVEQREAYCVAPSTRPMQTGQQLFGLRKDGHEFPTEISLCPLLSEGGFVVASAIRNVSEHKRLELDLRQRTEELEAAARHKDEFLAMLAHELRNPIGTIRNAIQVLNQVGQAASSLQWARDVIGRQATHMAHLVEDLLDASRIVNGKLSLQKEKVELGRVVSQAVETCRHLLNAREQQLTVSLPSKPVPLMADPTRLVQILTNLLNNAAKYTENGGQISLNTAEENAEVVMRVRDNGIGITAEMLPRVFDLFTQVPGAVDRSEGGISIGLAMVGHLVQLHGGTVHAFSDGPGLGSEFVVRLPLLPAAYASRAEPGKKGDPMAKAPLRRILIADDNADLVEAMALLLRRRGHEVYVASDGQVALAAAQAFGPEVAFLDIELPMLSGYEVARRLRQQPGLENVLLVATSGHAEDEIRDRTHDAGFDAHLAKPYRLDAVLNFLAQGRPRAFAAPRG